MKKSLSRILSVALVLAMVVSVVPFALADSVEAVLTAPESVKPGDTLKMSVTYPSLPEGAKLTETPVTYVWTGDVTGNTDSVSVVVPSDTEKVSYSGSVTVAYSYVMPSAEAGTEPVPVELTATKDYNVLVDYTISATADPESMELDVGETKQMKVVFSPTQTDAKYEFMSSDEEVASVDAYGNVTANKAGEAVITATISSPADIAPVTCAVKVTDDGHIECDNKDVAVGGTITLAPKLKLNGKVVEGATFEFESTGGVVPSSDGKTCTVTKTTAGAGVVEVKISVKSFTGSDGKPGDVSTIPSITAKARFYDTTEVEVVLDNGVTYFEFDDTNVFSSIKVDGTSRLSSYDLASILLSSASDRNNAKAIGFVSGSNLAGELLTTNFTVDLSWVEIARLSYVAFQQKNNRTGISEFSFDIYDADGLIITKGYLSIELTGTADIVYETDYATPVTFNEKDFYNFWNTASGVTGTLKYVVFNTLPVEGTLYTSASKTTKVGTSMKFQYNNSSTGYNDLDTVTYVPNTTIKTPYTVSIRFTAYGGTTGAQTLTGTVAIELNNDVTTITSRGVIFSNGVSGLIAADYKAAKNTDLSYVSFYLPDVEDGRLYYNYNGIMDSVRVAAKDKFYYYASDVKTRPSADLDKVAFVPAAGTTGKITLYYTGYDKNGANAYEGKITLNVTAKTKSDKFTDVTASSYSWAADSIDFLYYEEVVQGSGSKYNPASSITRGDFMIMLYRAFLEDKYGSYTVTSNFADVVKGTDSYSKETYQAVGVAKYLGIALGDGTNFKPKSSITREEAMTLIYRTLEKMDIDLEYTASKTTASFSDYSKVSTYAQTSISYLIRHGIVIGSNGLINPKSNITRAEMAVILHRVLTY